MGRQVTLPPLDSTVDPIGMYAGNPRLPMFPRQQLVEQTMESLAGDPGIRLSGSTSRPDRYFGTDAVPAPRYPTGRMRANREIDLEVAQQKAEPPRGPGLSE